MLFRSEMTAAFENCDIDIDGMMDLSGGGAYNEEELAEYRAGCEAGDMAACDDLWFAAPVDSDDEEFGATCGGTTDGTDAGSCDYMASISSELAEYRAGCEAGDMEACDDLYYAAPSGSDDEFIGATCGGKTDGSDPGWCAWED